MLDMPPHRYGPKSLLGTINRINIRDYLNEADRAKKAGQGLIRRACISYAAMLRAEFRNKRISD